MGRRSLRIRRRSWKDRSPTADSGSPQIEEEIRGYADQREKLKIVADYYRVRADKYAVLGQLPQSRRTFVISGYIPRSCAQKVAEYLAGKYDCAVDIEDLKEDEEAPVILKNNPFSANMEGVVESYGLPAKGEIDPTTIMSLLLCVLFRDDRSRTRHTGYRRGGVRDSGMEIPQDVSGDEKITETVFLLRDLHCCVGSPVRRIFSEISWISLSAKFFGRTITPPALWFVPLNEPMKLLLYSLLFGVIHLFTGLAIKGYLCIRDRKYMDFFCDVVLLVHAPDRTDPDAPSQQSVRLDLTDGDRIPGGAEYAGKGAGGGRSHRHRTHVRTQQ